MNRQKRNDIARANVVNYIIEKTQNDVEAGKLPQYVNDILEMNIDKINALCDAAKRYGVGAIVTAVASVAGVPVTMLLTNNIEDFKNAICLVLLSAGLSGLFMLVRGWARQDQRIAESKLIDLFVDRDYINVEEMPDDIYNDYLNKNIYGYNQNELF